ncbi:hypothetical protein CERSUDRAFT_58774 [Gelatoporia subvermispora B]|uniref:Uncharacterized protein n=1 Tax=Ceriporiopsis subvermispora (strain B) TaxID=914234 RepID=M2Q643_CERS8|nr:hypothetical protein CERSUDRAFT_58774 [Gelatoporia subvermispora B]
MTKQQDLVIRPLIPKAHIEGHRPSCRTAYSFNLTPGVGRTHGESIEAEWAHSGGTTSSTREMGPAARHAALDDHWGW